LNYRTFELSTHNRSFMGSTVVLCQCRFPINRN